MFDFFKSIKKMVGISKNADNKNTVQPQKSEPVEGKIDKLSNVFKYALNQVSYEFETIREKSKDLAGTNLKLGMKYLDEGNLKEAIFRFKLTKKFWPENYEAYYQLIICLILDEKFEEAEKLIHELSEKSPEYKVKLDQMMNSRSTSNQSEKSVAENQTA